MKFASSLLLLCVLALTACNTLATQRSVYRQNKGSGPYSKIIRDGIPRKGVPQPTQPTQAAPAPAPEPAPILVQ